MMMIIIMNIISSCSCLTSPDKFQMRTSREPLFDFDFHGFYHKTQTKTPPYAIGRTLNQSTSKRVTHQR